MIFRRTWGIERLVALQLERQSRLQDGSSAISAAMIIAGVAIAHGGEGAGVFAQLIVGIDASLQGVESFGLILRILLEGFHVIEAQVATD